MKRKCERRTKTYRAAKSQVDPATNISPPENLNISMVTSDGTASVICGTEEILSMKHLSPKSSNAFES